jgi:hypothetical protein
MVLGVYGVTLRLGITWLSLSHIFTHNSMSIARRTILYFGITSIYNHNGHSIYYFSPREVSTYTSSGFQEAESSR